MTSLVAAPPQTALREAPEPPAMRRGPFRRWAGDRPGIRGFRCVRFVTDLLLIVAAAGLVLASVEVASGRWTVRPVLSGSMRPALEVGSVALVQRIPVGEARVGDVLVLYRPAPSNALFVHRVIDLKRTADGIEVRTKGDNNSTADAGQLRVRGPYAHVVRRHLPYLGYVSVWQRSQDGRVAVLGLGGLVLIGAVGVLMAPNRRGRHEATT